MRIAINTCTLALGASEEDTYLRGVLAAMHAVQPDTEFVVLTDVGNHASFASYERICIGRPPKDDPDTPTAGSVDRAIRQGDIDRLFARLSNAPACGPGILVPYVTDIGDLEEAPQRLWGGSRLKSLRKRCAALPAVVVPSKYVQKALLERLGVPMNKAVVALPGVSEDYERAHPSLVERPYLLAVVHPSSRDNLAVVLKAFARIEGSVPHNLVVMGDLGPGEPDSWGERVLRIHECPSTFRSGLFQHSDALISCAGEDALGITVLEGMRSGTRVLAPRLGGIPEVGGHVPLYYKYDVLESLIGGIRRVLEETREDRQRHVTDGKQRARDFTWQDCAWKTLQALRRKPE
jgi:glycosyltransferase involved in cell wall biosynthesis